MLLSKLFNAVAAVDLAFSRWYWSNYGWLSKPECDLQCRRFVFPEIGRSLGYTRYGPVSESMLELGREINAKTLSTSFTPNTNDIETLAARLGIFNELCYESLSTFAALQSRPPVHQTQPSELVTLRK
jgi:hypothetical protein